MHSISNVVTIRSKFIGMNFFTANHRSISFIINRNQKKKKKREREKKIPFIKKIIKKVCFSFSFWLSLSLFLASTSCSLLYFHFFFILLSFYSHHSSLVNTFIHSNIYSNSSVSFLMRIANNIFFFPFGSFPYFFLYFCFLRLKCFRQRQTDKVLLE